MGRRKAIVLITAVVTALIVIFLSRRPEVPAPSEGALNDETVSTVVDVTLVRESADAPPPVEHIRLNHVWTAGERVRLACRQVSCRLSDRNEPVYESL